METKITQNISLEFEKWNKEVDDAIKQGNNTMIKLAKALHQIKEKELWKGSKYTSFTEYIEKKEELSKSYASQLVHICELGLDTKIENKEIGWNKAYAILPTLKKVSVKKRQEVIELAQDTPLNEIQNELIIQGYANRKTDEGIKTYPFTVSGNETEIEFIKKAVSEISKSEGITPVEVIVNALQIYYESEKGDKVEKQAQVINIKSRQFSDMFLAKHQEYRKSKYMFKGIRDKKLCDKLVHTFTLQELEGATNKFFTMIGAKKWWHSYNLGAFYTAINDLISDGVKIKDKYDEIEERSRKEYQE